MEESSGVQLVLCGTPIGNLGDVTERLRDTLASVDVVACEDTRRVRKLFSALGIPAPRLVSYSVADEQRSAQDVLALLLVGRTVALVSDAGMPSVADPGVALVRLAWDAGLRISVVPGPSAVTAALALSGFAASGYRFVGFLPRSERQLVQLYEQTAGEVIVAFDSPQRVARSVHVLAQLQPDRRVMLCRELTKRFEEVRRTTAAELGRELGGGPVKGEVVLVMDALASEEAPVTPELVRLVRALRDEGLGLRAVCRHVAAYSGVSARDLYEGVVGQQS